MENIPIESLGERLDEVVQRVEHGETIVVTRGGLPVLELVPKPAAAGLTWEERQSRHEAWKRERGIDRIVTYIAPDFDDPLPEDFLLQPLPVRSAKPL